LTRLTLHWNRRIDLPISHIVVGVVRPESEVRAGPTAGRLAMATLWPCAAQQRPAAFRRALLPAITGTNCPIFT
jgi:hypothetical protein